MRHLFVFLAAGAVFFRLAAGGAAPVWGANDNKPEVQQPPANDPAVKKPLEQSKAPGNDAKEGKAVEQPAPAKVPAEQPGPAKAGPEKRAAELPAGEKIAGGKKGEDEPPPPDESALLWLYHSMGLRYVIIFLAVSFNEMALVVMIVLGLRRSNICPLELATEFEGLLKKKQYQEAYDAAKKNDSFLGRVLASGMANLSDGYDAAVEAMQETGEEQTMRLEQRNGNIALIAQIGPMLGLLATVDGIVRAFAVIASKNVTPKPSELAQGIGIALVNTVVGLWIAIPSIVFYHFIRNRLTRLIFEAGLLSGRMMKRFSNVSATVKKG